MTFITLYHIDLSKNMHRFYAMDIQPDLFGNSCLLKRWGRIGNQGTLKSVPYPSASDAIEALTAQRQKKEKKGYFSHH